MYGLIIYFDGANVGTESRPTEDMTHYRVDLQNRDIVSISHLVLQQGLLHRVVTTTHCIVLIIDFVLNYLRGDLVE